MAEAGTSGSLGALFCARRAISDMRRRYRDEPSGPNETAWNDMAFLRLKDDMHQLERCPVDEGQH